MAVEKGESVRRAAEMFNVPKSTLHDHVTGKVMFGARSGPDPYLSMEEEEELNCKFSSRNCQDWLSPHKETSPLLGSADFGQ